MRTCCFKCYMLVIIIIIKLKRSLKYFHSCLTAYLKAYIKQQVCVIYTIANPYLIYFSNLLPIHTGTRGVCEYLRDIIREAAVQHTAHRLLPNMVPRVKGFVAIHDPTSVFLPCGLVSGEWLVIILESYIVRLLVTLK